MGKRIDRESPIHRTILSYLRAAMPDAVIHHSPNELNLRGDKVAKAIAQNKAKGLGMRPGWPDLEVFQSGTPYFFEVKAEGNTQTREQKNVQAELQAQGIRYAVVRSIADVRECLSEWGVITKEKGPL